MSSPIQRKLYALEDLATGTLLRARCPPTQSLAFPKDAGACATAQISNYRREGEAESMNADFGTNKATTYPLPTACHLNKIRLASSTLGKGGRRKLWKKKEKKGLSSPKLRLQFTGRKKTTTTRHRSLLVRPMPLIRISSSALMRRISLNASRSMLICSPGMSIGIRRLIPATPLSGSGLSAES